MTKSIEVVLQESLLQTAEDGGTTVNGLVTIRLEALKEIEAIMSRRVIGHTQYPDHGKDVTYDMYIGSTLQAKQRRRLQTALYGKEEN